MAHLRGLAVHYPLCANDFAAIRLADRLMPEANAEDGDAAAPAADRVDGDAGFFRRAGSGRKNDRRWCELADLVDRNGVVALHNDVRAKLAEVLDEVVRE